MKTSELIKYFEDEGYKAYSKELDIDFLNRSFIGVEDENGRIILIDTSDSIETYFSDLPFSKQQEYYKVIFEYLMTPPEEREEEKRYYLKIKGFSSEEETYLCAYDFWSDWILIDKDELKHGDEFYFKFTQKQIDEMPECYTHPAVWEQVEVEND